ncbi:MAG: YggS family pyridoxal phosphate-dependent enzyme [Prevotella sp.]|nr:YggS family pyridoxal phosphate-dependent enzyme [Prevotella sp.]
MKGDVSQNLRRVLDSLPPQVKLVAVSKYHPAESILEAYDEGQRAFGESHVQEMQVKHEVLPTDIEWHFIGHLQTNKVKYVVPYVAMIDAVDSMRLLREINRQAARHDRVVKVLLELHIAAEETKYGLSLDECRTLLDDGEWRTLDHVKICGLMMMASFVDDMEQVRREMLVAADFFDEVKAKYFAADDSFCERSWGMSHDYPVACECRSTMVRVGTSIFGERVY